MSNDAWTAADPTVCPTCGRYACDEHAPPGPLPNDPRLHHDMTDARHAEQFAKRWGADLKYDVRRGSWRQYDGVRWVMNDSAAVRRAVQFAKARQISALDIADPKIREQVVVYAIKAEARRAVDNVLSLARHFAPMRDDDEWDRDPWVLGCTNGVLDLRTGALRAARPSDRITLTTNVTYDATASAPRWRSFVREIFDGDDDLIDFVQKAAGYSLTGDTSEQVAFVCIGHGANGKSTFLSTLASILGEYAHVMPFATVERQQRGGIPNDLAALAGRRFVTASEVNEGSRWNESRVKALTGCDPIPARFLHAEFFTFKPVAKFWFGLNHKPESRDDSYAFWRRLRLIPFPCTFPLDKTLSGVLLGEAAGILAWVVDGCVRWQREGLDAPAVVSHATDEYREDSDPLADFLDTACEVVELSEVGASDLYKHYGRWADTAGLSDRERLTAQRFYVRMKERLRSEKRKYGRVYIGIARKDP